MTSADSLQVRGAVFTLAVLALFAAGASLPPDALTTIRHLTIQHNGRNKPFDSFARETLAAMTGSPRRGSEDPVDTVLSIIAEPERWQEERLLAVPFLPLREALGMPAKAAHVSLSELLATRKLMKMLPSIAEKQRRDEKLSMLENETWDLYERFVLLNDLLEQRLALVPPPSSTERTWLPILEPTGYPEERQLAVRHAWTALLESVRRHEPQAIASSAHQLAVVLRRANPSAYPAEWRLHWEVLYNRAAPFRAARLLYLFAVVGLALGLTASRPAVARIGLVALGMAYVLHGVGILSRVVLGGRPPVSNFYETMLWLPFVAVTLALVFERIYHARYFGLGAATLAAITLSLADRLPLDSSISPVVAVLRSNLWLTIHVLTIVASYGALALATVLAHLYGWFYLVRRRDASTLLTFGTFLYRTLQVGVVLLAAGIMLGAVWANASWGRYWGWDPKETWALITLLWFLATLHGRFAGWITGVGVALATIGGFFLLLMTYYGVSFYLVGLHSYAGGHATPIPPLLIAYLIAEVAFMAVVGATAISRKRPA